MEQAFGPVIEWLYSHWIWVLAFIGVFFEITPIKVHPISWLLGWLGKRLNGDIKKDVAELRKDNEDRFKATDERIDALKKETESRFNAVDQHMESSDRKADMQRMANIRTLVLDFANSCRNGRRHSKEEFTHILSENGVYEELVEKYSIKNDVYKSDYTFIKKIYDDCLINNSFLA